MSNEQNFTEVTLEIEDTKLTEKLETMAAELGIDPEEVVMMAIDDYLARTRNEKILNSIPTAEIIKALVKREGVNSLVQDGIHVIFAKMSSIDQEVAAKQ